MGTRARRAGAAGLIAVLGLGAGWAALDTIDLVPGVLTLEPPPEPAAPFPSAPGAVALTEADAVLAALDPADPMPDAGTVTAWARALVSDTRMGDSTSVVVADVLTGEVLADLDGDLGQVPASTAKLLTAMAALSALGPDRTLATTVVEGDPGELVLVGGGDMMLAAGAGDPDAVVGHAGLADLADQVAAAMAERGLDTVTLSVDDTLFAGPSIHPSWVPSDVSAGYVAAVTPLAVEIAKTDPEEPYPSRYPDPTANATGIFVDLLEDRGVAVTGDLVLAGAPEGAVEIARVESAPMADIVRLVLLVSENTVAEVLGRLVAVERGLEGSFAAAGSAVLAELAFLGLPVTGATLSDCSGLSTDSTLSADLLVDATLFAAEQPGLLAALSDLPVAGLDGTLVDRFTSGPGQGSVRAKTGSLPGVTSLAGTVQTADGRLLAFAVMADQTPDGGQGGPREAIDAWVQKLAGCGCTDAAA